METEWEKRLSDSEKLQFIFDWFDKQIVKHDIISFEAREVYKLQILLKNVIKKIDELGIGNIPTSEETYRMKLICLLESLECQDISELVKDSPEKLKKIGEEITKWAKIGASSDIRIPDKMLTLSDDEFKTISSSLRVAHSNCQNHLIDIGINEESRKIINKHIKNIEDLSKKLDVKLMEIK